MDTGFEQLTFKCKCSLWWEYLVKTQLWVSFCFEGNTQQAVYNQLRTACSTWSRSINCDSTDYIIKTVDGAEAKI